MLNSGTGEGKGGLDQMLGDNSRFSSNIPQDVCHNIIPLLNCALMKSQRESPVYLTNPRKERVVNPRTGQEEEFLTWYAASDGEVQKIAYDPDADMLYPGDTFKVPVAYDLFLNLTRNRPGIRREVYHRLREFKMAYEQRGTTSQEERGIYFKFF